MNYRALLCQAWNTIWQHKFLILLGILVALSSSSHAGAASGSQTLPQLGQTWQLQPAPDRSIELVAPLRAIGLPSIPLVPPFILVTVALTVGLTVWLVSTLARGALIAGASVAHDGAETSLGAAFATAWHKGWTLVGINLFPAVPALALLIVAWGAAALYAGLPPAIDGLDLASGPRNISLLLVILTCVALPLALVLDPLRTFANRACIIDGYGVLAAYGSGCRTLYDHLGSALLLLLIQVGIGIVLGLCLLLPALCCIFWPLLLLVQSTAVAFLSTMWTLAWRQWTSPQP